MWLERSLLSCETQISLELALILNLVFIFFPHLVVYNFVIICLPDIFVE